jgi:predicted N-acetyltransferase YhbS
MIIRQENPQDYPAVFELIQNAFKDEIHSDHQEQFLVERLRKSEAFIPELSLIAESNGKILGYILLTPIKIQNDREEFSSLALAPVAVLPSHQKQGIGGNLIQFAHQKAIDLNYTSIALLGHEDYYPKFGYRLAKNFDIKFPFEVPDENCMIIELERNALEKVSGILVYPQEFYGSQS